MKLMPQIPLFAQEPAKFREPGLQKMSPDESSVEFAPEIFQIHPAEIVKFLEKIQKEKGREGVYRATKVLQKMYGNQIVANAIQSLQETAGLPFEPEKEILWQSGQRHTISIKDRISSIELARKLRQENNLKAALARVSGNLQEYTKYKERAEKAQAIEEKEIYTIRKTKQKGKLAKPDENAPIMAVKASLYSHQTKEESAESQEEKTVALGDYRLQSKVMKNARESETTGEIYLERGKGIGYGQSQTAKENFRKWQDSIESQDIKGETDVALGVIEEKTEMDMWGSLSKGIGAKISKTKEANLLKSKAKLATGKGGRAEGELTVASVAGTLGTEASFDLRKEIKVKGNANAKATLVDGNAKIEIPAFEWHWLGEKFGVTIVGGVSFKVLAEIGGELEVNLQRESLHLSCGGKLEAFAGAKAGVEIGAKLQWHKNPPSSYEYLWNSLISWIAKEYPQATTLLFYAVTPEKLKQKTLPILIGTPGPRDIISVKGGVEGSAGFGYKLAGEIAFSPKIKFEGQLNITKGLGLGGNVAVELQPQEGIRAMVVLILQGANELNFYRDHCKSFLYDALLGK